MRACSRCTGGAWDAVRSRSPLHVFARRYVDHGWPVFPLLPRAKIPDGKLVPHGVHDASLELTQVDAWWEREPSSNVALACGHAFIVVDVDPRNGGKETMRALVTAHQRFPVTPVSYTGGGGWHALFATPLDASGEPIPLRSKIGEGVDIKGPGGYIVAPPSVHPSGALYEWAVNARPSRTSLAAMPAWLLALARRPPEPVSAPAGPPPQGAAARAQAYVDTMPAAVSGSGGHAATFAVARKLVQDFALSDDEAWGVLVGYNARCQPPWSERDLRHKLKSAKAARVRAPVPDRPLDRS